MGRWDDWSDGQKWAMGIVSALIVAGAIALGQHLISDSEPSAIKLVHPVDGSELDHVPRTLDLQWRRVSDAARYIVEIEIQHPPTGTWSRAPFGEDRLVTQEPSLTIDFIGSQGGRWRVTAISEDDLSIAESPWWYFRFLH